MDEEIFDESQLFSTFDSVENGDEHALLPRRRSESASVQSQSELDMLKQENILLKKLVRKIGSNPSEDRPLANMLFYNDACSQGKQGEFEDFIISRFIGTSAKHQLANDNASISNQPAAGKRNLMSDGFAMVLGQISDCTKLDYGELEYDISGLPMACIQYFTSFCLDSFGSDMEKVFPSPPNYDRVYFKTLPAAAGSKISQRRKLVCFNCDGDHRLNECSKKRDLAKISMKRREFNESRNDSRYHEDQAKIEQFQHLAPGKVTQKLKEALNMVDHDLPPFTYRMRMLGYPPSWLPGNHDSGIVVYGKEGREEQNDESNHLDPHKYVHFPGFNVPVPRACKDLANEIRLPLMHKESQLDVKPEEDLPPTENESCKRHLSSEDYDSPYHDSKRVKTFSESDMDVEDGPPGTSSCIETGTNNDAQDTASTKRTELEDGEIAESPGTQQADATEQPSWWIKEPLVTYFKDKQPEVVAPPFPLTPLPLHKISQILPGELNHISFEDRSRWLDPIFGNLQVRTGRYDKLKTILAARENKRKSL